MYHIVRNSRRKRTPLKHVRVSTHPQLSIKLCLDMTSIFNVLLLFLAMNHAGCGVKLCTVTKNSDDVYPSACLGRTPSINMFGHVPASPPYDLSIKPYLDMTSFGNLLLLLIAMTRAGCSLKL